MAHSADPGGIFKSDTHRRVLGHLSTPDDENGYTVTALFHRLVPDVGTNLTKVEEVQAVLNDLHEDGDINAYTVGDSTVYRQSEEGFERITGSIANEPPPGAEVEGPANVGLSAKDLAAPTKISSND